MAYNRPDVYFEEIVNQEKPIKVLGTSTAGFVGVAKRGDVANALLCNSWTEFVDKFSYGLSTPFLTGHYLANAVYAFFLNGGNRCYVARVVDTDAAAKATAKCPATTGADFTAIDEGTWANGFYVKVSANATVGTNFDIATYNGDPAGAGELLEKIYNVSNTSTNDRYFGKVYNGVSKFFTIQDGDTLSAATSAVFAGGDDGISGLADADFTAGINRLGGHSVNIVAVPGKNSTTINNAISTYCESNYAFGILETASGKTVAEAVTYKGTLTASEYSALYYPWVNIVDPLSESGANLLVPPSGFVAGIYAKTDINRGVHKAPAGIETAMKGIVSLETSFTNANLDTLNAAAVNAIVTKEGYGKVIWGARTMTADDRIYVSDTRFDINVEQSVQAGTAWVVFEPNDEELWVRFAQSLESFLYSLWKDSKSLKGTKKEEAYYVKCDSELNTADTIAAGEVIAEIGYARKTPAEFVVIKVMHKA